MTRLLALSVVLLLDVFPGGCRSTPPGPPRPCVKTCEADGGCAPDSCPQYD